MDNQEQLKQNFELPQPQADALPAPVTGAEAPVGATEQPSSSAPIPAATMTAQTASAVQSIVGGAPVAVPPSGHTAHLTASDIDLIEKEWVDKAKAIVAHTHGDPYTQNKEINKIKADYIKKRYNKDIKILNE